MELAAAQAELRHSFVGGGPGTIVSGAVWLIAAAVTLYTGIQTGFAALFFGGMLIFPIAALIARVVIKRPAPARDNPGARIVIETIFPMMGGLFAAWLMLNFRADFVFPLAAIAVGAHYFGFRSAYGDFNFWILGAAMCLVGLAGIFVQDLAIYLVPFMIAGIEIIYGIALTFRAMASRSE